MNEGQSFITLFIYGYGYFLLRAFMALAMSPALALALALAWNQLFMSIFLGIYDSDHWVVAQLMALALARAL